MLYREDRDVKGANAEDMVEVDSLSSSEEVTDMSVGSAPSSWSASTAKQVVEEKGGVRLGLRGRRGSKGSRKLLWLLLGFSLGVFGAFGAFEMAEAPSQELRSALHERGVSAPPRLDLDKMEPVEAITGEQKTVLVTGAAGFIGSHVAELLLRRGDNVVVVDEMNDYYDVAIKENNLKILERVQAEAEAAAAAAQTPAPALTVYRGDVADRDFITKVFAESKPDYVCHMAARAGVRPSIQDPLIYVHSNVEATTLLLEVASKVVPQVRNFVFASSSSVYGGSPSTYFKESEPVDFPISPYAATKKSTELMAYTFHHLYNISATGLRFFTVYGPRGRPDMAPFGFVDKVSRGETIRQFGDGSTSRDYTYVSDIVDGVVRAVDRPYPYQIFNLGRGQGTSLKDFIGLVEKHTGRKANIEVLPEQPGDVPYTRADISRATRLLGYNPQVPFSEGIRRTVEWYNATYINAPDANAQTPRETSKTRMLRAAQ